MKKFIQANQDRSNDQLSNLNCSVDDVDETEWSEINYRELDLCDNGQYVCRMPEYRLGNIRCDKFPDDQPNITFENNLRDRNIVFTYWIIGVFIILVVLLATAGSYLAYVFAPNYSIRTSVLFTFLSSMFLLFGWFVMFFNQRNIHYSFIISVMFSLVASFQMYFVWSVGDAYGYCMIPYVVFGVFLIKM